MPTMTALLLAADAVTPDLSPLWLQYGAIGLIAALGIWFAFKAYKREVDRGDKLAADVTRLNQALLDQARSTDASTAAMRDVVELLKDEHRSTSHRRS